LPGKKIVVKVDNGKDVFRAIEAGVEGIQCNKMPPREIGRVAAKTSARVPKPFIFATDGITRGTSRLMPLMTTHPSLRVSPLLKERGLKGELLSSYKKPFISVIQLFILRVRDGMKPSPFIGKNEIGALNDKGRDQA
jgi:hypothetical protein